MQLKVKFPEGVNNEDLATKLVILSGRNVQMHDTFSGEAYISLSEINDESHDRIIAACEKLGIDIA